MSQDQELFADVKNLSLELRNMIRAGIKEGVSERIEVRNQKLQQWFASVQALIHLTQEQQQFLEELLVEEQELLNTLQQEQHDLAHQQRQARNLTKYLDV